LGIRINSDVLNAEQQLYSSVQDLEKARYDTLFEGLKLKAAAGQLIPEDLQALHVLFEASQDAGVPDQDRNISREPARPVNP
jgi:outer membrane protein